MARVGAQRGVRWCGLPSYAGCPATEVVAVLLVTWNVNSIKQRMPRVLELLAAHRPDAVCLQETKAAPDAFPHLELQAAGYTAVDHSAGGWAGVAVLVRDDLPVGPSTVGLAGEPTPAEARWIEVEVAGVTLVSVYVINGRALDDPAFEAKLTFLDAMRERLATLAARGPVVVAGDFNVAPRDADVWDAARVHGGTHVSAAERERLGALLDVGLADAYLAAPQRSEHVFTWWDYRAGAFHKNLGMRIDLALVTDDLARRLEWCGIDRDFRKGSKPSDHAPLLVRLRPA